MLAIASMSQPSFINRYVYERFFYVTHASPFISIADALDLLIRISPATQSYLLDMPLPLQDTLLIRPLHRNHGNTM